MQITIKQIRHQSKTSQKTGNQFESCQILTTNSQGQDIWLSGFGSEITHTWEAGDIVDLDLEQRGEYWNFKENNNTKPSPDKKLELLSKIDRKLDLLLGLVQSYQSSGKNASEANFEPNNAMPNSSGDILISEIPF